MLERIQNADNIYAVNSHNVSCLLHGRKPPASKRAACRIKMIFKLFFVQLEKNACHLLSAAEEAVHIGPFFDRMVVLEPSTPVPQSVGTPAASV